MSQGTGIALKSLIVLLLVLLVACQVWVLPSVAASVAGRYPDLAYLAGPGIVIGVLFVLCVEVFLVCLWRLLTLARRDEVFSGSAFVYLDVCLATVAAATVLVGVTLAVLSGAGAAPAAIALLCLLGIVVGAGLVLLTLVLRGLLRQATQLAHDMSEVV